MPLMAMPTNADRRAKLLLSAGLQPDNPFAQMAYSGVTGQQLPPLIPQGEQLPDESGLGGASASDAAAAHTAFLARAGAPQMRGLPTDMGGLNKETVTKAIIDGKPPTPGTRTDDLLAAHSAQVDDGLEAKKQALLDSANAEVRQAKHPSLYESLYQDPNRPQPSDPTGMGRRMAALATAPDTGFPWQAPAGEPVYSKAPTPKFGLDVPPEEMAARREAYEGRLAAKKAESDNLRRWRAVGPDLLMSKTIQGGEAGDMGLLAALGGPQAIGAKVNADAERAIQDRRAGAMEKVAGIQAGARDAENRMNNDWRMLMAKLQNEAAMRQADVQEKVGLAQTKTARKASKRNLAAAEADRASREKLGMAGMDVQRESNKAQNELAKAQLQQQDPLNTLKAIMGDPALAAAAGRPSTEEAEIATGKLGPMLKKKLDEINASEKWKSVLWYDSDDSFIDYAMEQGIPREIAQEYVDSVKGTNWQPEKNWF